jgi:hypothetical protein
LWCCGEAGISWDGVGMIDILENTKWGDVFGVVE